jgi:hypothetical protein
VPLEIRNFRAGHGELLELGIDIGSDLGRQVYGKAKEASSQVLVGSASIRFVPRDGIAEDIMPRLQCPSPPGASVVEDAITVCRPLHPAHQHENSR